MLMQLTDASFAHCRDGTSSIVLLIGELMKQAERYLQEGSHPRVIVEVRMCTGWCPRHCTVHLQWQKLGVKQHVLLHNSNEGQERKKAMLCKLAAAGDLPASVECPA
jgi:hypothetical protein